MWVVGQNLFCIVSFPWIEHCRKNWCFYVYIVVHLLCSFGKFYIHFVHLKHKNIDLLQKFFLPVLRVFYVEIQNKCRHLPVWYDRKSPLLPTLKAFIVWKLFSTNVSASPFSWYLVAYPYLFKRQKITTHGWLSSKIQYQPPPPYAYCHPNPYKSHGKRTAFLYLRFSSSFTSAGLMVRAFIRVIVRKAPFPKRFLLSQSSGLAPLSLFPPTLFYIRSVQMYRVFYSVERTNERRFLLRYIFRRDLWGSWMLMFAGVRGCGYIAFHSECVVVLVVVFRIYMALSFSRGKEIQSASFGFW